MKRIAWQNWRKWCNRQYVRQQLRNPMIMMLVCVTLLFACIFGFHLFKKLLIRHAMNKNMSPIVTVSAMPARYQTWQPTLLAYGSLRAVNGVNITTEYAGLVTQIYFKPGSMVKAGDKLVQLNADSDIALLHSLQAQERLAEITYERDKAQFAVKAISKAVLDNDQQNLKNLQAQVAQQNAVIAKKSLVAPFDGRLGVSLVNPGQYINVGDPVVTLQAMDPLYADFYVPQQYLLQLKQGAGVTIKTDTYPNNVFKGTVTTINPLVDVATRNVEIEATLVNPELKLYPGMFVSAYVEIGSPQRYLTLPQTAISFNSYGSMVYLIQPQSKQKNKTLQGKRVYKVQQNFVEIGDKRGDQVAVLKGIKAGTWVVTSGQLKLKNGSDIVINNTVLPEDQINPAVMDE